MPQFTLREELGLTQAEFAMKFHLSVRAVQSWEQGWRQCPSHLLYMMRHIVELEKELKAANEQLESYAELAIRCEDDGR